jgi:hypothetical protein
MVSSTVGSVLARSVPNACVSVAQVVRKRATARAAARRLTRAQRGAGVQEVGDGARRGAAAQARRGARRAQAQGHPERARDLLGGAPPALWARWRCGECMAVTTGCTHSSTCAKRNWPLLRLLCTNCVQTQKGSRASGAGLGSCPCVGGMSTGCCLPACTSCCVCLLPTWPRVCVSVMRADHLVVWHLTMGVLGAAGGFPGRGRPGRVGRLRPRGCRGTGGARPRACVGFMTWCCLELGVRCADVSCAAQMRWQGAYVCMKPLPG